MGGRRGLGYLKFFDESLPIDDEMNYYMEREWRVLGNLNFDPSQVVGVLVPEGMVEQCRADCPEFAERVMAIPAWDAVRGEM